MKTTILTHKEAAQAIATGKIPASVGFSQTSGNIHTLTKAEKKAQKDLATVRHARRILADLGYVSN